MTKGVYCASCRESIHELQPHCDQCGVSVCFDCATPYNSIVRGHIFKSKINTLSKPIISIWELKQFYNDISCTEMIDEIIKNECDSGCDFYNLKSNGYNIEMYKDDMNKVKTFWDKMRKKYNYNDSKITDEDDIKELKSIVWRLDLYQYGSVPFICYMCHKGIKVEY